MTPLQVKDCPPEVYQALKDCAARENRSISQQTITILQEYLGLREKSVSAAPRQELSHVGALRRVCQLQPVSLSADCPSPAQLVRQLREEEAR